MRTGSGLCPRCGGSGLIDGIPCSVCSTQTRTARAPPDGMCLEDFVRPDGIDVKPLNVGNYFEENEKRAAAVLREDAGKTFEFESVGIDEFRDVVFSLETDGHTDPVWILGATIADQIRETVDRIVWEDDDGGMPTTIDMNPVYESDTLRANEAFCVGPRAVEPTSKYVTVGPPIVVRRPSGVARVTL